MSGSPLRRSFSAGGNYFLYLSYATDGPCHSMRCYFFLILCAWQFSLEIMSPELVGIAQDTVRILHKIIFFKRIVLVLPRIKNMAFSKPLLQLCPHHFGEGCRSFCPPFSPWEYVGGESEGGKNRGLICLLRSPAFLTSVRNVSPFCVQANNDEFFLLFWFFFFESHK